VLTIRPLQYPAVEKVAGKPVRVWRESTCGLWQGWYGDIGDIDGPVYFATDDPLACAVGVLDRAGEWLASKGQT
jgi:hypothetical protein